MPKMKSHSGAKKRFKRDRHGQAARPSLLLEPHPREEVTQAQAPLRPGPSRSPRRTRRGCASCSRRSRSDPRQALRPRAQEAPRRRSRGRRATAARPTRRTSRAKEALLKADAYAYRDRRNRKRDFRRLWITRINAAARREGMSLLASSCTACAGRRRAGPQGPGRHRRARPRDLPTICRTRPRGDGGLSLSKPTHEPSGRRSSGAAPFFVLRSQTRSLSSTTNSSRRSASSPGGGWRDKLGRRSWPRVRISSPRPMRPAGRRASATSQLERGLEGVEVEPEVLAKVSPLGSGTRALGVYEQRWAAPVGPLCVYLRGRRRPRQRRHRAALGAWPSAPAASRSGPGCADPFGPQGGARVDGRDLLGARGAGRRAGRPARPTVALVAARGRAAVGAGTRRRRRSSSAPSAKACPTRSWRPATTVAHPDRRRLAERRDGRDGRPVRADANRIAAS